MGRDDLERRLEGYYAAERDELRAPAGLWDSVSARLGEQDPAPWWQRVLGGVAGQGVGRVYAGAAAAVALLVVGVFMYTTIIGAGGPGSSQESMASDTPGTTAAAIAAAAPAPAAAPVAESAPAAAPAAAMAEAPETTAPTGAVETHAMSADAVPRAPSGLTQNAAAGVAETDELPFRHEIWGLLNGSRTHLFWIALPERWESSEPMYAGGVWSGVISGPGVTLAYTFGERVQSETLRAGTLADAAANKQRVWDEYVIGNLAFVTAPPEGRVGDLLMTLQLPTGTLRFTGDALGPVQQEWALMVFRSIIA